MKVELKLTSGEANVLAAVLASVGGCQDGPRGNIDNISKKLSELGVTFENGPFAEKDVFGEDDPYLDLKKITGHVFLFSEGEENG